jgi:hypothetical protein
VRMEIVTQGVEWDTRFWSEYPRKLERRLQDLLERWKNKLVREIRASAPKVSGELRRSVSGYVDRAISSIIIEIGAPQAFFVEFGTGIYGEGPEATHRPIRPKFARALKIPIGRYRSIGSAPAETQAFELRPGKVRAGTAFIFRMEVQGQRATHFASRIVDKYRPAIEQEVLELMAAFDA